MALCHDERDFAMGFSRHNPHARRAKSANELQAEQERKRYLLSLNVYQYRAYERVKFCLAAVGQFLHAKGETTLIRTADLHRLFPAFAADMGYRGKLYQQKDGVCPAIDIAYPKREGTFWFLTPDGNYSQLDKKARVEVHSPVVRRAALNFCKAWLPNWGWDRVQLK